MTRKNFFSVILFAVECMNCVLAFAESGMAFKVPTVMDRRFVVATIFSSIVICNKHASATMIDNSSEEYNTFKPGVPLNVEEAKLRFKGAISDIDELIKDYDNISRGGGDNVRRYIGTVGVTSRMYGITKVLKQLREEADDVVEFTETYNDFEAYLFQAEGAAYQSLFVEFSSAKGSPEQFLATAKEDIIMMRKYMGLLAKLLNL